MGNSLNNEDRTNLYISKLKGLKRVDEECIGGSRIYSSVHCITSSGKHILVKVCGYSESEEQNMEEAFKIFKKIGSVINPVHSIVEFSNILHSSLYRNTQAYYLIRPFVHTNLVDRLCCRPFPSKLIRLWYMFQLFKAVRSLHFKDKNNKVQRTGLFHGDIRSENICLTDFDWVFLTDIGMYKPKKLVKNNSKTLPITEFERFFKTSGDSTTIAPERIGFQELGFSESDDVGEKFDVFSLGCVFASLWRYGKDLFTWENLVKYCKGEEKYVKKEIASGRVGNILSGMLCRNPQKRFSLEEAYSKFDRFVPKYFQPFHNFFEKLLLCSADRKIFLTDLFFWDLMKLLQSQTKIEKGEITKLRKTAGLREFLGKENNPKRVAYEIYKFKKANKDKLVASYRSFLSQSSKNKKKTKVRRKRLVVIEKEEKEELEGEGEENRKTPRTQGTPKFDNSQYDKYVEVVKSEERKNLEYFIEETKNLSKSIEEGYNPDLLENTIVQKVEQISFPDLDTGEIPDKFLLEMEGGELRFPLRLKEWGDTSKVGVDLIAILFCSSIRASECSANIIKGLRRLRILSHFSKDYTRLQRIIPCTCNLLTSPSSYENPIIIQQALETIVFTCKNIEKLPADEINLFSDYIFPYLMKLTKKIDRDSTNQCLLGRVAIARNFIELGKIGCNLAVAEENKSIGIKAICESEKRKIAEHVLKLVEIFLKDKNISVILEMLKSFVHLEAIYNHSLKKMDVDKMYVLLLRLSRRIEKNNCDEFADQENLSALKCYYFKGLSELGIYRDKEIMDVLTDNSRNNSVLKGSVLKSLKVLCSKKSFLQEVYSFKGTDKQFLEISKLVCPFLKSDVPEFLQFIAIEVLCKISVSWGILGTQYELIPLINEQDELFDLFKVTEVSLLELVSCRRRNTNTNTKNTSSLATVGSKIENAIGSITPEKNSRKFDGFLNVDTTRIHSILQADLENYSKFFELRPFVLFPETCTRTSSWRISDYDSSSSNYNSVGPDNESVLLKNSKHQLESSFQKELISENNQTIDCSIPQEDKEFRPRGSLYCSFHEHREEIRSLCFSGESKFLFSGSLGGVVKGWDMRFIGELYKKKKSNPFVSCFTYPLNLNKDAEITSLSCFEKTKILAISDRQGALEFIDFGKSRCKAVRGMELLEGRLELVDLKKRDISQSTVFYENRKYVASKFYLFAKNWIRLLKSFQNYGSNSSNCIFGVSHYGDIHEIDGRTKECEVNIFRNPDSNTPLKFGYPTAICGTNYWFLTATSYGYLTLWDLRNRSPVFQWETLNGFPISDVLVKDGNSVIVSHETGVITEINLENNQSEITRIYSVCKSRDWDTIFQAYPNMGEKKSEEFAVPKLDSLTSQNQHEFNVNCCCLNSKKGFFSCGNDKAIRYWDFDSPYSGSIIFSSQFNQSNLNLSGKTKNTNNNINIKSSKLIFGDFEVSCFEDESVYIEGGGYRIINNNIINSSSSSLHPQTLDIHRGKINSCCLVSSLSGFVKLATGDSLGCIKLWN